MYDGRYIFRAYRFDPLLEYALIAFDPATKAFEKIEINASLTNSPLIDGFYDMVLNEEGTVAYLLGLSTDVSPYELYLVSVDLTTGQVYFPDEPYYLPENEFVMGTLSWVNETDQILLIGISASPSDYFNATNKTYLLTPVYKGTSVEEWSTDTWKVFPNPAADVLRLQGNGQPYTSVAIRDLQGRTVWNQVYGQVTDEPLYIDIRMLPAGMYLLTVHGTSDSRSTEVMIVR